MKTLITAIALTSLAAPALAQEVRFTVEYRDLDLATEAGQATLERRIDTAARKACGVEARSTGTRLRTSNARQCVQELRAKARQQFAAITANEDKGG